MNKGQIYSYNLINLKYFKSNLNPRNIRHKQINLSITWILHVHDSLSPIIHANRGTRARRSWEDVARVSLPPSLPSRPPTILWILPNLTLLLLLLPYTKWTLNVMHSIPPNKSGIVIDWCDHCHVLRWCHLKNLKKTQFRTYFIGDERIRSGKHIFSSRPWKFWSINLMGL